MAGRRSSDKWNKWVQLGTVGLTLIFVIVVGFGLSEMFSEIKTITKGQQALILHLAQKSMQDNQEPLAENKVADECVSKVSFIKYQNETSREIKELQKKLDLLRQRVRAMKSPL